MLDLHAQGHGSLVGSSSTSCSSSRAACVGGRRRCRAAAPPRAQAALQQACTSPLCISSSSTSSTSCIASSSSSPAPRGSTSRWQGLRTRRTVVPCSTAPTAPQPSPQHYDPIARARGRKARLDGLLELRALYRNFIRAKTFLGLPSPVYTPAEAPRAASGASGGWCSGGCCMHAPCAYTGAMQPRATPLHTPPPARARAQPAHTQMHAACFRTAMYAALLLLPPTPCHPITMPRTIAAAEVDAQSLSYEQLEEFQEEERRKEAVEAVAEMLLISEQLKVGTGTHTRLRGRLQMLLQPPRHAPSATTVAATAPVPPCHDARWACAPCPWASVSCWCRRAWARPAPPRKLRRWCAAAARSTATS